MRDNFEQILSLEQLQALTENPAACSNVVTSPLVAQSSVITRRSLESALG